ncbi:MAG TPA: VIT1/CCC1 transporter family protein [Nitrososphaerales archaeon]|nr:VIT1/CCC1 transporter family protein [Nitrososphaerales archaeon]
MESPAQQEKHPHIPARRILDRIVLGGSDGAIEGLAMTAALNGAGLSFGTILLAGFAFAVAGSVSMFFSSYLSNKSELDLLRTDVNREKMEIETEPEEERAEMEQLLMKDGYDPKEVKTIMARLLKDKELWLKEQLRRELRINIEDLEADPFVRPASAGLAFLLLALMTLAPYAFSAERIVALALSVVLSLAALFALSSRIFIPAHFKPLAGFESAFIGGAAGGLLYIVGILISRV